MVAEIITIGDEILIGQIVDTNSAWIAQKLNHIGIRIKQISSVSDAREAILKALDEAKKRADVVLITGGLGPTNDDVTKAALCEYFNSKLVINEKALADITVLFNSRGFSVSEVNRKQAEVPDKAVPIQNSTGTAPGLWFEQDNKIFVSMPGVPYEMMAMMEKTIIPKLAKRFVTPTIVHRTVLTQGIGESYLAHKIKSWEDSLPKEMKLAYLPSPGMVRLRITAIDNNRERIQDNVDKQVEELVGIIDEYVYGYDDQRLEEIVGQLLKEANKTLSIAESCTGGQVAHLITSIPGSSAYFKGALVPYDNQMKVKLLGVKKETLEKYGAVSEETVKEMAAASNKYFDTDYSIAISGIAGPSGATPEKPVGLVWIGIGTPYGIVTNKFLFGDNRERTILKSAISAINMLRKELLKEW
jgi:nicotinamide-nucleotide amidase